MFVIGAVIRPERTEILMTLAVAIGNTETHKTFGFMLEY